jgi:hypothetical protein
MSERSIRRAHQRETQRRSRRATAIGTLAAGAALLAPGAAQAATFEVNEKNDTLSNTDCDDAVCTLRDAIDEADASPGLDTITFASSVTGTITLTEGALSVYGNGTDGLVIDGPGAATLEISGDYDSNGAVTHQTDADQGDSRVFELIGSSSANRQPVTIQDLTLADGLASSYDGIDEEALPQRGGAISSRYTNLTLADSVVKDSYATSSGGGIAADRVTIQNTTVSGNLAREFGGGIHILGNGYAPGGDPGASSISDSTISGNRAGVDDVEGETLFPGQDPLVRGGGIAFQGFGNSTIEGTTVSGNTASASYAYTSSYTSNQGESGGMSLRDYSGGAGQVLDVTVTGNTSRRSVGGVSAVGDIEIADSLFSGNEAGLNSGGVSLASEAVLRESTVRDNEAASGGGGVRLRDDALLSNSTVSGNTAGTNGGGVYVTGNNGSPSAVDSTTIARNTATGNGGGLFSQSNYAIPTSAYAPAVVSNTVVGDNTSTDNFNVSGAVGATPGANLVVATFSLFESVNNTVLVGASSNKLGVDPKLGPLAVNGAGTLPTHLPNATSPVVDAANSALAADQRGQGRPVDDPAVANAAGGNTTDIGAVERQEGDPAGDTTPPNTTFVTAPPTTGATAPFVFTFNSSEVGSTFECSLDGAAFAACTSPQSIASLANGSHTFRVRAIDGSGNVDASPASHTFTVGGGGTAPDTTAPTTELTKTPKKKIKSKKKKAKVSFEFTGADAVTPASGLEFECSLDGGEFASCTSPFTAKVKKGKHSFAVRAVDAAGNADATPASFDFTVKVKKKKK